MKSLEQIAKEATRHAIETARIHGYKVNPFRSVFFVSDTAELEGEILHWLINHMRPEERE